MDTRSILENVVCRIRLSLPARPVMISSAVLHTFGFLPGAPPSGGPDPANPYEQF